MYSSSGVSQVRIFSDVAEKQAARIPRHAVKHFRARSNERRQSERHGFYLHHAAGITKKALCSERISNVSYNIVPPYVESSCASVTELAAGTERGCDCRRRFCESAGDAGTRSHRAVSYCAQESTVARLVDRRWRCDSVRESGSAARHETHACACGFSMRPEISRTPDEVCLRVPPLRPVAWFPDIARGSRPWTPQPRNGISGRGAGGFGVRATPPPRPALRARSMLLSTVSFPASLRP